MRRGATWLLGLITCFALTAPKAWSQDETEKPAEQDKPAPKPAVIPADRIKAPTGFQVDLIYSVPKETQGSWVNLAVDPKGRLIVSDQYGKLYRVTLPKLDDKAGAPEIEPIELEIGEAQGLLWAFDSLYVVVNRGNKYDSGLYRVRDTDGDDKLDSVELLRKLEGGGEHGPHAVLLAPDGQSLYVIAGNATALPELNGSLVPRVWGEDTLLPRLPDGAGFMADERAPGGYVCRVTPDGKEWTLVSMGFRNPFDMAFNKDGELFTYDSDMEWDVNLPWYRPTRVCHVVSGSDFGYRGGSGKFPPAYIDNLPPVVDVGPGSPTGVCFGYGAKFPAKYQDALYVCDWSYGKLYAVHLKPQGASYSGELEEFVAGTPLALTDVVVNPHDGAMYFAVGGRNTQSGLYRVTYNGSESTAPAIAPSDPSGTLARATRHVLEQDAGRNDVAVDKIWPELSAADRFVRYVARAALEMQPVEGWRDQALAENKTPESALNALLALARVSAKDPAHRTPDDAQPDPALRDQILSALDRLDWGKLNDTQRLDLLRVYEVVLNRFGSPDETVVAKLVTKFDGIYPSASRPINVELAGLLVFLQAPNAAAKTVALLYQAPTQEEQIELARSLRFLKQGWNRDLRKAYFQWFVKAAQYRGGNSFGGFLKRIERDALENVSEEEKPELLAILETRKTESAAPAPARPFVKAWTLEELASVVEPGLRNCDFARGRVLFGEAKCFSCHRFNNEGGGVGPDLSGIAGRFSTNDLLDSIVNPSKTISDQYEAVDIATTDGRVITGRIVNLNNDVLMINPNMLDPNNMVVVKRGEIEEMKKSMISMMPADLLNSLDLEEVLDLMAYLLSRGEATNAMFRQGAAAQADAFFNGKDLSGWEGLTEFWSVREGAIVGTAPAEGLTFNTFLCSKKKYKDFELSFKVRIKDHNGNSGVQIRSRVDDAKQFAVAGPQCDMGQQYWGSLYGERDPGRMMQASPPDLVKRVLKPNDFNDYSIKVVGKHVTIKLNGETTVDADFAELPDEGIIAWQLHAGFKNMEVVFKDIKFQELK
jgi:putative heme-binding domain-containing protein